MGKDSAIEWTDHTFNIRWGCTKIGLGCVNCYAERWARRWRYDVWGPTAGRRFFGDRHWNEPRRWNRVAQKARQPAFVFCGSMCDIFERHPDPHIDSRMTDDILRLWDLIEETPWLVWLLLTKRPENVEAMLPESWLLDRRFSPQRNAWLGYSASTQDDFDAGWPLVESIGRLYRMPTFLSLEPLLGPVKLGEWLGYQSEPFEHWEAYPTGWVIVGGETGPGARPMHIQWARDLRDECELYGVPFHFKQYGEWLPALDCAALGLLGGKRTYQYHRWPDQLVSFRVGRQAAGHLLDGVEHLARPEVRALEGIVLTSEEKKAQEVS